MKKLVTLVLLAFITAPSNAQWEEQDVKFLLLKNFVSHIEWPEDFNPKEFKIGVYSSLDVYKQVSQMDIRPRHAGTETVSYYYLRSHDELIACNIIYVPEGNSHEIPKIKQKMVGYPVVIISEHPVGLDHGATINFIENDKGNIGYQVNEDDLHSSGVKFSYQILEGSTVAN